MKTTTLAGGTREVPLLGGELGRIQRATLALNARCPRGDGGTFGSRLKNAQFQFCLYVPLARGRVRVDVLGPYESASALVARMDAFTA